MGFRGGGGGGGGGSGSSSGSSSSSTSSSSSGSSSSSSRPHLLRLPRTWRGKRVFSDVLQCSMQSAVMLKLCFRLGFQHTLELCRKVLASLNV